MRSSRYTKVLLSIIFVSFVSLLGSAATKALRPLFFVEVGAEIIATACPFCLSTLEDAVLTSGLDHSVKVMDIAEIIAKVL
jgi:Fe-S oxidoreductase